MLIFDENTMIRAKFSNSFVLCDSEHGIAKSDVDDNIDSDNYEFVETEAGQECWVICGLFSETYGTSAMTFVYIPKLDFATNVLSTYVTLD